MTDDAIQILRPSPSATVLRITMDLNGNSIDLLRHAFRLVEDEIRESERSGWLVVADIRDVEFLDSPGIHVLLGAKVRLDVEGARFAVIDRSDERRLLSVAGVDTNFEIHQDEAFIRQHQRPRP